MNNQGETSVPKPTTPAANSGSAVTKKSRKGYNVSVFEPTELSCSTYDISQNVPFFQVQCKQCLKWFLKKTYLDRHVANVHAAVLKKYICPHCGVPCESRSNLKTHGFTKHNLLIKNEEMIVEDVENEDATEN